MPSESAIANAKLVSDDRWQVVQRVASSKTFASSQALQEFLLYVAEHAFNGHADEIKQQTIGTEDLRRHADFDPAADNIVRSRAGQLRQKLEQLFQSEGGS